MRPELIYLLKITKNCENTSTDARQKNMFSNLIPRKGNSKPDHEKAAFAMTWIPSNKEHNHQVMHMISERQNRHFMHE